MIKVQLKFVSKFIFKYISNNKKQKYIAFAYSTTNSQFDKENYQTNLLFFMFLNLIIFTRFNNFI